MNNNYIGTLYDEFDNDRFEREDRIIDFNNNNFKGGINIMRSTGIVRKVDELGRVVLPIELRRTMGIQEKDSLEIYTDDDKIILQKYKRGCMFCGELENVQEVKGVLVCDKCANEIVKTLGKK